MNIFNKRYLIIKFFLYKNILNRIFMYKLLLGIGTGIMIYYYRKHIPFILNDLYFLFKNVYYKHFLSNNFIKIKEKSIPNSSLLIIEYIYKNSNYLIVKDKNKIYFPPYRMQFIESVRNDNSLNTIVKSDKDIIMANLRYSMIDNKNNANSEYELDVLNLIQQLSGPIGNFYDNSENKSTKQELINFFQYKFKKYHIESLWIMLSDGNEFNLI